MANESFKFKGYLIIYYGPSDERFTYRFRIDKEMIRNNISNLIQFFEKYDRKLSEIARWFDRKIFGPHAFEFVPELKKYIKVTGDYIVEITVTTPTIHYLLHSLKSKFAQALRTKLLYIEAKPMYIYVASESKLKEIYNLKKEIDVSLEKLNYIYNAFQSIFINHINKLLSECGLDIKIPNRRKIITHITMKVVPIDIDISELAKMDPEVSEMIADALKTHITEIMRGIFKQYANDLKNLINNKYVDVPMLRRKIEYVKEHLNELGIYRLVEPIFNEIDEIILEPSKLLLRYGDFEEWKNKKLEELNNKLIELVEIRRLS